MALIELHFCDKGELKKAGRSFDCAKCPDNIKKLRRCEEDREDFTELDGGLWPMYIQRGGGLYSFCPAKATWEKELIEIFKNLEITAITGSMLFPGSISEQPDWYIDLLTIFLPVYDAQKFSTRMKSIFGDGKTKPQQGTSIKGGSRRGRNH